MSLQDSMHLVLQAFTNAQPGDLFVKKAPASNLETLVNGLCLVLGVENVKTNTIGIRHGEKLHDTLLTTEELARSSNTEAFFSVPTDNRSLNYRKYTEEGENPSNTSPSVYDSSSTNQLNATEVAALIESLPEFQVHMGRK
jgi:UDP-glucose 4-epimerase